MWKSQNTRIPDFSCLFPPQHKAFGAQVHDTTGRLAEDHSDYIETSERQPAQATEATLSSSQATEGSHASVPWQATEEVGASLPFNSMLQLLSDIDGKQYAFDQHDNQFVCTQEAVCAQQAGAIEEGSSWWYPADQSVSRGTFTSVQMQELLLIRDRFVTIEYPPPACSSNTQTY